jgi:hypothetical protein
MTSSPNSKISSRVKRPRRRSVVSRSAAGAKIRAALRSMLPDFINHLPDADWEKLKKDEDARRRKEATL